MNRIAIVLASTVLAVGIGLAGYTGLQAHDRALYAQAVQSHSEVILNQPCSLGIDPSTGRPTADGVIVSPDEEVTASRSCSSDLIVIWTDRRLAEASAGYCGSGWASDNARLTDCLAWWRKVAPASSGLPWEGLHLDTVDTPAVLSPCTVRDVSEGCKEWSE